MGRSKDSSCPALSEHQLLDPLNEVHLFSLHHVYLPRINRALTEMERDWAFHPISTANNRSPRQLWHYGMNRLSRVDPQSGEEAIGMCMWNEHGIDEEAPSPDINSDNNVVVPETRVSLNNEQEQQLKQVVDPLFDDNNEGINNYQRAVQEVKNLLSA